MSTQKSKKLSSPFLIGLFVIIGVTIIVGVILWLGASQFLKEQTHYVTYFDGSVEGLESGSAVKYQGVPIGNVTGITVAPDSVLVEVVLRVEKGININDSLRVQQTIAGITGTKFLQLYYPEDPSIMNMYPKLNFEPPYQYIKPSPSSLEETFIAARQVMQNLSRLKINKLNTEIINFLQTYQSFIQNDEIHQTISNIQTSSEKLKNMLTKADTSNILANLQNSTKGLVKASQDMVVMTQKLNKQIDDMKLPMYIEKAYTRYDNTMETADRTINDIGFRAENFIINLSGALEELQKTNTEIQKTLRSLNDSPSQIFLSEPPPKEK